MMDDRKAENRRALAHALAPLRDTATGLYSNALNAVHSTLESRGFPAAKAHAQSIVERYEDVQLTQRMSKVA